MIMIALMCTRIPPSPDNLKKVIKYQTFQTPFYSGFESIVNIVFSFEANFGQGFIQSYQTVAMTVHSMTVLRGKKMLLCGKA